MTTFSSIPDLISSSVTINPEIERNVFSRGTKYQTSGTIYPLTPQKTGFRQLISEIKSISRLQETRKIFFFIGINVIGTLILLFWCHATNSMALRAFTYLTFYDILSLLVCLLSEWVRRQRPSPAYLFGYERFEVLAVFASTMLAKLGALFIIKESIERLLMQPDVHTGRLLIGTVGAFMLHIVVTYGVRNKAMNHVIDASSSSWLQEHVTDMSESVCSVVPGLSKILLPRINPLALIGFASGTALFITYLLIDTKMYFSADTWAAISIAIMTCGTMFPMSVYTGKILLQTAPSHILGQLDKLLREASTLDGVLEFRHEHFWTLSFGTLAGSVQVRVRRDADEQMVLAHVYNRLTNLVTYLTVQIFKDDWNRASSYNLLGSHSFQSSLPSSPTGRQEGQSPTNEYASQVGYGAKPLNPMPATPFDAQGRYMSNSYMYSSTPIKGSTSYMPSTPYTKGYDGK